MNTLFIYSAEYDGQEVLLRGDRASHYQAELDIEQPIRIAVQGQFRARARVVANTQREIRISIEEIVEPAERLNVALVVAVPRPQTVKKVISLAVQAGISSLYFVRAFHTVPSYLQSKTLEPVGIEQEVNKALEQVWDFQSPQILVVTRMKQLFEQILPQWRACHPDSPLLLGEPKADQTRSLACMVDRQPPPAALLAIGPEKGWGTDEQRGFADAGFSIVHLADREYRVETALALFLGQLSLIMRPRD